MRAGKRFTFIYFELRYEFFYQNYNDEVTKTVIYELRKQESGFLGGLLASFAASLVQPVIFCSIVKGIRGRGVRRVERGYMDKNC